MIELLAFALPVSVIVAFSMIAILSSNVIYSVLSLMMCFVGLSGLAFIMGADFIALLLLIIYVGAVVVLFLFVVMMMKNKVTNFELGSFEKHYIMLLVFITVGAFLFLLSLDVMPQFELLSSNYPVELNITSIAVELYQYNALHLQLMGTLLFIGVVGAVALTLEYNATNRRHITLESQLLRTRDEGVSLIKVESGKGVDY